MYKQLSGQISRQPSGQLYMRIYRTDIRVDTHTQADLHTDNQADLHTDTQVDTQTDIIILAFISR